MRALRRILALIYLLSGALVIAMFAGYLFSPAARNIEVLFQKPAVRIVLLVCMVILGLGTLVATIRMMAHRRVVTCVHPQANPDIEVSLAAIESVARSAAQDPTALDRSRCRSGARSYRRHRTWQRQPDRARAAYPGACDSCARHHARRCGRNRVRALPSQQDHDYDSGGYS